MIQMTHGGDGKYQILSPWTRLSITAPATVIIRSTRRPFIPVTTIWPLSWKVRQVRSRTFDTAALRYGTCGSERQMEQKINNRRLHAGWLNLGGVFRRLEVKHRYITCDQSVAVPAPCTCKDGRPGSQLHTRAYTLAPRFSFFPFPCQPQTNQAVARGRGLTKTMVFCHAANGVCHEFRPEQENSFLLRISSIRDNNAT